MSATGEDNVMPSHHSLEPLLLVQSDPRERGRVQGEEWRDAIHELATIRLEMRLDGSGRKGEAELLAEASQHLSALQAQFPAMGAELVGIAEGADLSPQRVLVLNHYCDLPSSSRTEGMDPGGGTAIYFSGDRGALLGETLDLHANAEPHMRMLRIAPKGSEEEVLCLTVAGCLGMTGINARGVAITANCLSSGEGVGVVWPAVVRAMLEQPDAAAARALLKRVPLASGHHYIIADGEDYYGVETSAELQVLTQLGPKAAHLHTNHCFDPVLRKRERVRRSSTSFARLNLATTIYAQERPRDADALWTLLHTRDGTRGSLCIDPDPRAEPFATATCAVIVMRLADGWLRVVRGADPRAPALELAVQRWRGQPASRP